MHIYPKNTAIKPMKATDYNRVSDKWKPTGQFIIEQKFDGARVIILIPNKDSIELYSGNGHRFHFPALENQVLELIGKNYNTHPIRMLDGELCYGSGKSEDRSSISGRLNSALHGKEIRENENVIFHCFDALAAGQYDAMLVDRVNLKDALINEYIKGKSPPVFDGSHIKFTFPLVMYQYPTNVKDIIQQEFNRQIAAGNEGIMLKRLSGKYEPGKRSKDWLKLKAENTVDLKCIGVEPGTGKYEGMIGALILQGGGRSVKVGSGLVDAERAGNSQDFIGKTIEIKYNCLTEDSFFLPIFKRVRLDK